MVNWIRPESRILKVVRQELILLTRDQVFRGVNDLFTLSLNTSLQWNSLMIFQKGLSAFEVLRC